MPAEVHATAAVPADDGRRLAALRRVTEVFAATADADGDQLLLDAVLDAAAEVLAPCSVALVRRSGPRGVFPAGERGRPLLLGALHSVDDLEPRGPLRDALLEGSESWVETDWFAGSGVATGSGLVPLLVDTDVVGVLVVALERPGPMPASDREFLRCLAGVAAEAVRRTSQLSEHRRITISNVALHAAATAFARSETPQETLEAMLEAIRDLVGPAGWAGAGLLDDDDVVQVTRLQPTTRAFERFAIHPGSPNFVMSAVIRDGKARRFHSRDELLAEFPAYAPRLSWDSGVVEPIVVGNRTVGSLSLVHRAPHRLAESDRLLVSSLATLCGEGLRRIGLRQVVRQANNRAAALHQVTEAFSRSTTVSEVVDTATAALLEGFDAPVAAAVLIDEDGQVRRWFRRSGPIEVAEVTVAAAISEPEQAVLHDGRPRHYASAEELFLEFPGSRWVHGSGGAAFLPVALDGLPLGVLAVSFGAQRTARPADHSFGESLASLCAEAVRRAGRYEEERRSAARLRTLHRLTSALARAATVSEVFAVAVDEILVTLGADAVGASVLRDGAVHVVQAVGLDPAGRTVDAPAPPESPPPPALCDALLDGVVRWYETNQPSEFGSWGAGGLVPILIDGSPAAVFGVAFADPRPIPVADRELLLTVADLCGEALYRAADFERTSEAAERYERLFTSYEELFRNHPQPMLVYDDENLAVLAVNTALIDAFGYSEEEFLGLHLTDLVEPELREGLVAAAADRRARKVETSTSGLFPVRRKDGSGFVAEASGRNAVTFAGRPARLVLLSDQTARVAAEADRQRLRERVAAVAGGERRRLAADLHDGPVQRLSAVALRLDLLQRDDAVPDGSLGGITGEVRSTLEELRQLLPQLYPRALAGLPLGEALRRLYQDRDEVEPGGDQRPVVRIEDRLTVTVPEAVRTSLFRVALEALANVQQHAAASEALVEFDEQDGAIVLRVTDDGVGIAEGTSSAPGHLGLLAMVDQMAVVGGRCRVFRGGAGGTVVEAIVPLPQRAGTPSGELPEGSG